MKRVSFLHRWPHIAAGLFALAVMLLPGTAPADAPASPAVPTPSANSHRKTEAELTSIADNLQPKHGKITLQNGVVTLDVPEQFDFLDAADARKVIVDLFGNPPNVADGVLGMIVPAGQRMDEARSWGATISYLDEGYVKDDDAEKINYDDMLKQMKESMEERNAERTKNGYPALHLVGWAQPPHYDKEAKKLYWAKELASDGAQSHSLNYEIRILGRRGILVVEPIARMQELDEVTQAAPQILKMIEFNQGNRYADFNPKTDKVAPYALAGLIGGGLLLAKVGGLKWLFAALLAAKKFVIVGLVAVGAFFKRLFGGGTKVNTDRPGPPTGVV